MNNMTILNKACLGVALVVICLFGFPLFSIYVQNNKINKKIQLYEANIKTESIIEKTLIVCYEMDSLRAHGLSIPIYEQSKNNNLDWQLTVAVISAESGFNTLATSVKDAQGLMQIIPTTAQVFSDSIGITKLSLKDPTQNIAIGTRYIAYLISRYKTIDDALRYYNAGQISRSSELVSHSYKENIIREYRKLKLISKGLSQ